MKEELRPRLRLAMTTPSYACTRLRSPSTTLTFTITVSPGANTGTVLPRRVISSCSSLSIRFMSRLLVSSGLLPLRQPLRVLFPLEFLKQLRFFRAQGALCQQIRPSQPGPAQRLLQAPAFDLGVVAGEQHRRHGLARILLGPGVMRTIEQSAHKRILRRRILVAQHAGQLPHHRVDQHHRRQLPAGEHIVADRYLLVDRAADQSLVHALVAPAQQYCAWSRREFHHFAVIEHPALRRKVYHLALTAGDAPFGRTNRLFQRLGQHHHAGPAAIRPVVHRAVVVAGEVARIPQLQTVARRLQRAADDTRFSERREHLRKQRHAIEVDHQSSSHSTRIRPWAISTWRTTCSTKGSRRSVSPSTTRITGCAPFSKSSVTTPSSSSCAFTTFRPTRSTQ